MLAPFFMLLYHCFTLIVGSRSNAAYIHNQYSRVRGMRRWVCRLEDRSIRQNSSRGSQSHPWPAAARHPRQNPRWADQHQSFRQVRACCDWSALWSCKSGARIDQKENTWEHPTPHINRWELLGGRPKTSRVKEGLVLRLSKEGCSYISIRENTGLALSTIRRIIVEKEVVAAWTFHHIS